MLFKKLLFMLLRKNWLIFFRNSEARFYFKNTQTNVGVIEAL